MWTYYIFSTMFNTVVDWTTNNEWPRIGLEPSDEIQYYGCTLNGIKACGYILSTPVPPCPLMSRTNSIMYHEWHNGYHCLKNVSLK